MNLPHLALLAALPPYWLLSAGLSPQARVTLGTLLGLAWLLLAERLRPYRSDWAPERGEWRRDGVFLGLGALTDTLGALLLGLLLMQGGSPLPPVNLPFALALPLALLLGELGPWLLHRQAHRGGWLWRVHALHHRPHKLNAANAVLVHPLNLLWNQAARQLPWWLLGLEPEVMAAATLFLQLQSLAVHANLRGDLGPLGGWIGHAGLHRWHHSLEPAEALNFGTALPLFDRLAGSFHAGPGAPAALGLRGLAPPRLAELRSLLGRPLCACLG